jgi:outer membrane protein assembly factor BamD (BamD/ComL family)
MKACCRLLFIFLLLFTSRTPARAQLGFNLDIKKPAPYENRELKAEKSGTKKFNVPRRILQNTFTHYNYFFNANNKLNDIIARAKGVHRDDYSELLPFYNYELSTTAQDKGELDSVIYKSKTGILLHDLRNDWVDDLYLLWGAAYYLQEQYDSAYQMFQFINYAFAPKEKDGYYKYIGSRMDGAAANRIATDEKMKFPKGMIADPPARNNALLWEVRSLIGAGSMAEAGSLLNALRNDPVFPERLRDDLEEVQALWYYKQERWDSAAFHLKGALGNAQTAQERARWEYLAAQLFVKTMQPEQATELFNKAIGHTVDPVLELYARLNLIRINKEGGENYIDQNIAALLKMARRDKYRDYRDAIYYMAGEMELERNNYDKAQEYFFMAAKYRGENPETAGKGFLQLADLYYKQKKYLQAAQFYDSVQIENMPTEAAQQLATRKETLSGLVSHLLVVQRQDSLQRLAALPEKERDDYIRKLARQLRRQRGLSEESTTNNNPAAANIPSKEKEDADLFGSSNAKGEWYFYNENTRTQGAAAFKRIWGKRPNVDNWRRYSDVMAQLQDNVPTDARGNPATLIVDEAVAFSYDGLLAQLPLTDEKKQQSNDSIANALYTAGRLYTDNIEDYESAIQTYEELRRRFPAFENGEEVLFQLYYSYTKTGNSVKAAEVKALLAKNYPEGRYTGIATTGKDAANTTAGNKEATKAYEAVYDLFLEGRFDEARSAKDAADAAYGTTTWQPQLLYIEAVYHIKQGADSAAKQTLETLIAQNGDSPISEKATTLLDVLSRRREIEKELNELQIERPVEEAPYIEPDRVVTAKANRMAVDTAVVKKDLVLDKPIALRRDTLVTKPIVLPNKPKVFTYQPAETHFAVVLLNKVDVVFGNEARNAFARYNREKYYNRTLELSVIPLNDDVKLLVIGRFENVQGALDYVQKAKPISATEIMPWLKGDKYSFSLISESNLQLLQENGDLPGYQAFLDKNLPVKF